MTSESNAHAHEWAVLQNNIEHYEHLAVGIKLIAIVMAAQLGWLGWPWLGAVIVLVLWLQEAIIRTSQSRLVDRILALEQAPPSTPHRLHTEWQAKRAGMLGLIREYLAQSLRPTVAFPYPVLVLILITTRLLAD